jgi:hypothetical protein
MHRPPHKGVKEAFDNISFLLVLFGFGFNTGGFK